MTLENINTIQFAAGRKPAESYRSIGIAYAWGYTRGYRAGMNDYKAKRAGYSVPPESKSVFFYNGWSQGYDDGWQCLSIEDHVKNRGKKTK